MNKKDIIHVYLTKIGSKGGKISRRTLTTEQAMNMVKAREAKRKLEKESEEK